jgi:putative ABC transport system permease protein
MLKSILAIAFRSYFRNRAAVFINIMGLGIAISCCIAGYFNWKFKHDWDKNHLNSERIYRIQFHSDQPGDTADYGVVPMAIAKEIRTSMGGMGEVVRYCPLVKEVKIGQDTYRSHFAYVDSAFFDLFSFPLLRGLAADLRKDMIFISEDAALRYFNTIDVVGQKLFLPGDGPASFLTIVGVFANQPFNSSFPNDGFLLYSNLEDSSVGRHINTSGQQQWTTTFLKTESPQSVPYIERQLKGFVGTQNNGRYGPSVSRFYLQKFADMANESVARPGVRWQQLRYGVPSEAVLVPNITALLLLVLACFNFTNTSISIAGTRIREIGVRKTIGAGKWQIASQFFMESFALCTAALLVGLLLAEFIVPAYNSLWPFLKLEIRYFDDPYFSLYLILLLLLTTVMAGSYPAFYVSSFEPLAILTGKARVRAGGWFNRLLLGSILMLSVVGLVFAFAFYGNSKFQADYDLGYSTSDILCITLDKPDDFTVIRNSMTGSEHVALIAGTRDHVSKGASVRTARFGDMEKTVEGMDVGENYLETMGMKIREGRGFRAGSETDRIESVLVTEEFVRQFGWRDSTIGKRIVLDDSVGLMIIGVLSDIYTHSVFEAVRPLVVRFISPGSYKYAILRSKPLGMSVVARLAKEQVQKSFPGKLYDFELMDRVKESANRVNSNGVKIVGCLVVFSLTISLTGFYTMASLNIARRTKEMGIRKVLGATTGNIIAVINAGYFSLLTVAGVVGALGGYFLVDLVMKTMWQYYLNISAGALVFCLFLWLTTGFMILVLKTLFVSSMNPVHSLRAE